MVDQQQEEYLTGDEVILRLKELSRADLQRIKQISMYIARSAQDAEDLRQEAYKRALNGSRRCGRDQDFVRFLAGAMQSIQHARLKGMVRLKPHEELLQRMPNAISASPPPDPLGVLLEQEHEFHLAMGKLKLFGDDPIALTLIEGIMEGFQGAELCELAGITPQELATKRRLIKRRLDAAGGLKK